MNSEDSKYWKDKYLSSLQTVKSYEKREGAWEARFELLRRTLTRTSMAAEGQDPRLDECLGELRKVLVKDEGEMDAGLNYLTPRLEKVLLDSDQRRQTRIMQISKSLRQMVGRLQETAITGKTRRSLKRLTKRLDDRVGQWGELQVMLYELDNLQRETIQSLELPPRPGFLERIFGSAHPDNDHPNVLLGGDGPQDVRDSQDDGEEAPSAEETLDTPEDDEEAPEVIAGIAPPSRTGDANDLEPAKDFFLTKQSDSSAQELPIVAAPSVPSPAPEVKPPKNLPRSSDLSVSTDSFERENRLAASLADMASRLRQETSVESPMSAQIEPPPYSTVADRIENILLSLLDDLYQAEQWQTQVEMLRRRIKAGLNWYELISVLEDMAALLRVLPLFDQQFEEYLQQLHDRVDQMQDNLDKANQRVQEQSQHSDGFSHDLRNQVDGFQAEARQATELDALKQLVDERLENILQSVDNFQMEARACGQETSGSLQELGDRLSSMEEASEDLRNHLEEQQRKAHTDALTGLPNRVALTERLEHEVARWRKEGGSLLLAVMDVDHFKRINDNYGHLAGDRVLKILAGRWRDALRPNDFMARYGGEEFVILLPNTTASQGREILERLRVSIEECPFHFKGERLKITVSAGFTAFLDNLAAEEVFERADQALYRAKNNGRNRVECGI